jgi:hypothetical protein
VANEKKQYTDSEERKIQDTRVTPIVVQKASEQYGHHQKNQGALWRREGRNEFETVFVFILGFGLGFAYALFLAVAHH